MKLVVGSGSTGFSNFTDGCPADADRTIDSDFVKVTYPADKATLQNQIDGKIESWFQSNDPATAWTTTAIKQSHNGDWWWNTSTQKLKRYTGTIWSADLTDKTAIDAFDKASTAQSTADGKMVVFTTTPSNYDVGDLWDVGGNPRTLKRATVARTTYVAGDWITIANEVTNTNQVTDGAGLGLKADWQFVTGANRPADNADRTQTALDLGASIDNAKANGSTLISGGYIRTSLIKTDAIIIGDLSGASTFTAYNTNRVNGTAASTVVNNASTGAAAATTVDRWKYLNTTYIDGGNIYTNTIVANHILANEITVDKIYERAGINGRRIGLSESGVISVVYEVRDYGWEWLGTGLYFSHTIHHGLGRHCIVQAFYKKIYTWQGDVLLLYRSKCLSGWNSYYFFRYQ